jgi:hypothetical protein
MPSLTQQEGSTSGPRRNQCPSDAPTLEEYQRRIQLFLGESRCTEADIAAQSPVRILDEPFGQTVFFLKNLYDINDQINIVWDYTPNGPDKAAPTGYGKTQSMGEWVGRDFYNTHEVPQSAAGAWIRMNPLNGQGISNRDVESHRFTLVEFDFLPVEEQLAFFARIKLPIAALVLSGGRSVHAWVRVGASSAKIYTERVNAIFKWLRAFGIDQANKNPNRLARLPGAIRTIGAVGQGIQKLLYLNPNPSSEGLT